MVLKESGFNQSVAATGMCSGSIATMRDVKLVQMPHSCHYVETIPHPNTSYVTPNCTERLHVVATIIRYFQYHCDHVFCYYSP